MWIKYNIAFSASEKTALECTEIPQTFCIDGLSTSISWVQYARIGPGQNNLAANLPAGPWALPPPQNILCSMTTGHRKPELPPSQHIQVSLPNSCYITLNSSRNQTAGFKYVWNCCLFSLHRDTAWRWLHRFFPDKVLSVPTWKSRTGYRNPGASAPAPARGTRWQPVGPGWNCCSNKNRWEATWQLLSTTLNSGSRNIPLPTRKASANTTHTVCSAL